MKSSLLWWSDSKFLKSVYLLLKNETCNLGLLNKGNVFSRERISSE